MQKGSAYNEVHGGLETSISNLNKPGEALCRRGVQFVVVANVA